MSLVLRDGKGPEVAVCLLPTELDCVGDGKASFPALSNALLMGGPSFLDTPAQGESELGPEDLWSPESLNNPLRGMRLVVTFSESLL